METSPPRYRAEDLLAFGKALFVAAGQPADRAADVAEVLLEGDLLGHTTHGLALLGLYLRETKEGRMPRAGVPRVVADHGASLAWDADYLPGPWVVRRAIDAARARLATHPVATVTVAHSHHIACLQAYLKPVTDAGLVILLAGTDPSHRSVAPHGSMQAVFSPNPLAAGIPTRGDPVLIDISMSTTALGVCARAARSGAKLPGKWLVDAAGDPTDDPGPLVREKKGALYTLGGADLGHKGFGLALLLEALTSGLAGRGRARGDAHWGCSIFLQLIDPEKFGGLEAFLDETSFLAGACRAADVPEGKPRVRLPGEGALSRRAAQLTDGVALHPEIIAALAPWAEELGVAVPTPAT